ncbi:hypothetical protein DFP73DRAFT_538511 [Morchella snyderi]|nr:hypothetical protein DFP73DRAFT_538511 [Morchella snyderi]
MQPVYVLCFFLNLSRESAFLSPNRGSCGVCGIGALILKCARCRIGSRSEVMGSRISSSRTSEGRRERGGENVVGLVEEGTPNGVGLGSATSGRLGNMEVNAGTDGAYHALRVLRVLVG